MIVGRDPAELRLLALSRAAATPDAIQPQEIVHGTAGHVELSTIEAAYREAVGTGADVVCNCAANGTLHFQSPRWAAGKKTLPPGSGSRSQSGRRMSAAGVSTPKRTLKAPLVEGSCIMTFDVA